MRTEMRTEVRRQELMATRAQRRPAQPDSVRAAALSLFQVYEDLAQRGAHLLGDLLHGQPPRQWAHYPADDARDPVGYQWFYHSHGPEDRPGAVEHGHIHLFARRPLWGRRLRSRAEAAFIELSGKRPAIDPPTRHLLSIGFNAKGLPTSLFAVNSWVTGDLMLNAGLTLDLLTHMRLDTGHAAIDEVLTSLVQLHRHELLVLMAHRDEALKRHDATDKLADERLEKLSELHLDLDARLAEALG